MNLFKKHLFCQAFFTLVLLILSGCTLVNMKVEESPNSLRKDQLDLNLLMNSIERDVASIFENGSRFGMQVTRMYHMYGPVYQNAYSPVNFDVFWRRAYADLLKDCDIAITQADEKKFYRESGIARIIKSYMYLVLVDMFVDVPYVDALKDETNTTPTPTKGDQVYKLCVQELKKAIKNLQDDSPIPPSADRLNLYFSSNADWISLANTLLMRTYLNEGNGVAFKEILDGGKYLGASGSKLDWKFSYGTSNSSPDSRHPRFADNYVNGANDYMSNYFMNLMVSTSDPRVGYYFYRQKASDTNDPNEKPCIKATKPSHYGTDDVFCLIGSGYWGRDHGDNSGIPPDNTQRTIWGVYPFGGKYDKESRRGAGKASSGAAGRGISPLMMSFYTDFMRAEAALNLGTGENAKTLLENGVRNSIEKVIGFPSSVGYAVTKDVPKQTNIDAYVKTITDAYDAASSDEEKLGVISKEYYKSLFGNGFEVYNLYRRTGYPNNLQPTLQKEPGDFIYSFYYPANSVNRNPNMVQKTINVRPFWDKKKLKLK